MKLLILGGTVFLGRHLVDAALAHGHEITLFNRGEHNPELYPQVEKLRGNRDGDLSALEGREWDAVIDTCGYVPRVVKASAELLAKAVKHYTFISTLSVYADPNIPGLDENGELATMPDPTNETVTEFYGALKVLCEKVVQDALPGRNLIIRPGLIVGPYDPTDRFTYWPHRIAEGGEVLVPGRRDREIQFIDVRDLAEWTLRMVEAGKTGVYNANGPSSLDNPTTMEQLVNSCKTVSGSDAKIEWVAEQTLFDQKVGPWIELPLWMPETGDDVKYAGFFKFDCSKAIAEGLTFRAVDDTVRATLDWDATRPTDIERRAGMKREREAEILQAWHATQA